MEENNLKEIINRCLEIGGGLFLAENGFPIYQDKDAVTQLAAIVVHLSERVKTLEANPKRELKK